MVITGDGPVVYSRLCALLVQHIAIHKQKNNKNFFIFSLIYLMNTFFVVPSLYLMMLIPFCGLSMYCPEVL